MTDTALTLALTVVATGETFTTKHANIPAATRYLELFALGRGWLYSRSKVATNSWKGAFTKSNGAEHLATYTLTK